MIPEEFIVFGVLFNVTGNISYVTATIKGKTRPNRVSWFLWAVAPLIAFSAQLKHGVGLASLMTFMVGFGPLVVFAASFVNRKSSWRLTKLDIVCGVFSVFGLILWQMTGSGSLAILFSIIADGLAGIPTIVKSYTDPESESWYAFLSGGISAGLTLLALDTWDFAHYGFPLYIFSLCAVLVVLIKFKIGMHWHRRFAADLSNEDERPLP